MRTRLIQQWLTIWMAFFLLPISAKAQHNHHQHPPREAAPIELPAGHEELKEQNETGENSTPPVPDPPMNRATGYLFNFSSGTSLNPASWSMPMEMSRAGAWNLMWMGEASFVSRQQTGPRGQDQLFSTNWGMLAAARNVGKGSVMLRSMVSLEPLTVRNKKYPLLFQTGETADGRPIVDGQHPHELLMEFSVQYAHPLSRRAIVNVYYAPVGDAALGPVAFPHRASARELPQAPLGHHWQDSTHIANNVLSAGLAYGMFRIEASGFRGKEPNENRWNIDMGAMDSWASRLTFEPSRNWLAQVSVGRIERPEASHPDDVVRTTASIHYTRPLRDGTDWSTSLIWARNYKTVGRYATNAVLAETVLPIRSRNHVSARLEWSQRDELFEYDHDLAHDIYEQTGKRAFNVGAFTVGYTRELAKFRSVETALGMNATLYSTGATLQRFYGNNPVAVTTFLRIRLKGGE